MVMIICGTALVAAALIFCFFGYKLAHLILPLCGLVVLAGLGYLFLFDFFAQGGFDKWVIIICGIVAVYLMLYLFKRVASFIVGTMGSALVLIFLAIAFNLGEIKYIVPIIVTIALVVGLLSFVYKRGGVIMATSLLGGGAASLVSMSLIFGRIREFNGLEDLVSSVAKFLTANAVLVSVVSIGFVIFGVLVQAYATGKNPILPRRNSGKLLRRKQKPIVVSDKKNTFV